MKRALILMNHEDEGPATLGDYMLETGVELRTARLYKGDGVPEGEGPWDLIVSMGGPMGACDDDLYPFLEPESAFLKTEINAGRPVLGVCLGAQLMARALGAKVYKAPEKEVGWREIFLTGEGAKDPLFKGVPAVLDVLQWHEDTFDLPQGSVLMAWGNACRHQAFRFKNAYALQFHVEVNRAILDRWFGTSENGKEVIDKYLDLESDYSTKARKIYSNLMKLV